MSTAGDGARLHIRSNSDQGFNYWWASADGGATFTQHAPLPGFMENSALAGSADGLTLLSARRAACDATGQCGDPWDLRLLSSADGGATWTERTAPGADKFVILAVSGDGRRLMAGQRVFSEQGGGAVLWHSGDGGGTWARHDFPPGCCPYCCNDGPCCKEEQTIVRLAASHDGTRLLALMANGYPWTSSDGGATWAERRAPAFASGRGFHDGAMSADGLRLVVLMDRTVVPPGGGTPWSEGVPLVSADGGATWQERAIGGGSVPARRVACSADGSRLVAAGDGTRVFTSADFGATWAKDGQPLPSTPP